jgi:hypothetical protein
LRCRISRTPTVGGDEEEGGWPLLSGAARVPYPVLSAVLSAAICVCHWARSRMSTAKTQKWFRVWLRHRRLVT